MTYVVYVVLGQAAAAAEVRRLELSLQEERDRLRRQAEAETLPGGEAAWRTDAVVEAAAVSPRARARCRWFILCRSAG